MPSLPLFSPPSAGTAASVAPTVVLNSTPAASIVSNNGQTTMKTGDEKIAKINATSENNNDESETLATTTEMEKSLIYQYNLIYKLNQILFKQN